VEMICGEGEFKAWNELLKV